MCKFDKYLSVAILALLAACSGDDSASSNEVESSDAPYSLEASSSSVGSSSSSSEESSSSGMFVVDERDGQVYRTVVIGDQEWMAENLNYDAPNSRCVNDSCKYGRLYTWGSAMDSMGVFSKNGVACHPSWNCSPAYPVQGLCMTGWHLPDSSEFARLLLTVGADETTSAMLRAKEGWPEGGNGTDEYGFSAYPITSYGAYYWSSSEEKEWAGELSLLCNLDKGIVSYAYKESVKSIRCVKGAASDDTSFIGKLRSPSGKQYVTFGTMTDERDGQTYKTVTINNQTWMAENLNYAYLQPTSTLDSSSWCYDNDPENCKKYGRLYLWSAAMDSAALFSKDGMGCGLSRSHALCEGHRDCPTCYGNGDMFARGVCPEKWKMPTLQEFEELFEVIGKKTDSLKSTTGWEEGLNGSDHYGFNVLPSGFRVEGVFDYDTQDSSFFWGMGKATFFWTTHRYGDSFASSMEFVEYDDYDTPFKATSYQEYDDYDEALLEFPVEANAVRCIKHE